MRESDAIDRLRRIATAPEARGLRDDVAVLDGLVISHDSIAQGVHFLADDPPESVGWKLVGMNLSDLAGKGATPAGALLSLTLSGDGQWETKFLDGLEAACKHYSLSLIGGDTLRLPDGAPRVLGMTVIGRAAGPVPDRSGGRAGDELWLVGTLGDAAAGLARLRHSPRGAGPLVEAYRQPVPLLEAGKALAPVAHAMMDVSDGLLLDARRLGHASDCEIAIAIDALPLSSAFVAEHGDGLDARMFAATGGDDYALLAAMPAGFLPATLCLPAGTIITRIGTLPAGVSRLGLSWHGEAVDLPEKLGFEHDSARHGSGPSSPLADRS
ncbi:MAG: thiamine-phosphate kinase [Sphingomicrobium sp.]